MTTSNAVDAVVQLSYTVQSQLSRIAAQHELSLTQLRLFGILRDHQPSMAAIADHLGLDRSSVSGLIDRAERRGLVTRHASSADARVTTVQLTTTGTELATTVAAAVQASVEQLLSSVPAVDRERLFRVAELISSEL